MSYLITGLISIAVTLITYFITRHIDNKREGKKELRAEKMRIFKTLMAKRGVLCDYQKVEALNSISVIFCKSKPVVEAWGSYRDALDFSDSLPEDEQAEKMKQAEDKLIVLLETMSKDLKLIDDIDWTTIKKSYTPKWIVSNTKAGLASNELMIKANQYTGFPNILVNSKGGRKK